ncbi:MAG TPA: hypothetical protein PLF22_00205 [Pseudomonadales bacterium]|nr:hypothetical protein [Pseudomonadales bacterium]
MNEKLPAVAIYIIFGTILALLPTLAIRFRSSPSIQHENTFLWPTILLLVGCVSFIQAVTPVFLACILFATILSSFREEAILNRSSLAVLTALLFGSSLIWWRRDDSGNLHVSLPEALVIISIFSASFRLLSLRLPEVNKTEHRMNPVAWYGLILVFFISTVWFSATTSLLDIVPAKFLAWHHWGAYIQSSELLLSGAKVFHDFPVQYGLGPTLLVASTCSESCWTGMYHTVWISSCFFVLLIAYIGTNLIAGIRQTHILAMALASTIACCFFWQGLPPLNTLPLSTPSTSGLRFLPAAVLSAYLVSISKGDSLTRFNIVSAQILWVINMAWSVESAFYGTFIWWPFYIFCKATETEQNLSISRHIVFCFSKLALSVVAFFVISTGIYWVVYRDMPLINGYLAYFLSPPGVLPVNIHGSIMFFFAVILIGTLDMFFALKNGTHIEIVKKKFIVLLLCYSVFSYFLGRSHDNNILNLLPFQLLVLLSVLSSPHPQLRQLSTGLIASILACLPVFGWTAFTYAFSINALSKFGVEEFIPQLSYANTETASEIKMRQSDIGNPEDAAHAIEQIELQYHEPVTLISEEALLASTKADNVWSALQDVANYVSISTTDRQLFLDNTAKTLKKSGWLVYPKNSNIDWLENFGKTYNEDITIDFSTYIAKRYIPKDNSAN